jgi:hypothetical protein
MGSRAETNQKKGLVIVSDILLKRSLKLDHVSTSKLSDVTALPGLRVSGSLGILGFHSLME